MVEVIKYLEWFAFVIIGTQVLYFLVFAAAGVFRWRPKTITDQSNTTKFAVLIPGYKEDNIIVETAAEALAVDYPKHLVDVYVLADSFKTETLDELKKTGVNVLEVSFEHSTKAKSINKGLNHIFGNVPDAVVILDADNIMEKDFLKKADKAFRAGYKIIQGHRTAKNTDTVFSFLDAANEEIGNHIFRKGHRVLKLSSALIGSGMIFDYHLFKRYMEKIADVAGEDKLLEMMLLKDNQLIEYLPDAIVYDEKVASSKVFGKQRTRWIGAQLYFFRKHFIDGLKQLFAKGNINYFDKCFQMALIPKVILIGFLGAIALISLLIPEVSKKWIIITIAYYIAMIIAVPARMHGKNMFVAILHIPKAIFVLLLSILKINKQTAVRFEVTDKNVKNKPFKTGVDK